MAALEVSYVGAVGAGILSFLSPCVLPLVPSYLCFIGGVSLDELTGEEEARKADNTAATGRVLMSALMFVLGFSVVFVALGASASAISGYLLANQELLSRIAGVVIILFGLHFMGLLRLRAFNVEARMHLQSRPAGQVGAFIIGLAFAFGWTPCIGPVLATILSVAASQDSLSYGTTLLFSYAMGLGIPFLIAAAAAGPFMRWTRGMRKHMRTIELVTGGLLVLTGVLFLFNSFQIMAIWLLEWFPVLGEIG